MVYIIQLCQNLKIRYSNIKFYKTFFYSVMPWAEILNSLIDMYQCFGGTCWLFCPENGGSKFSKVVVPVIYQSTCFHVSEECLVLAALEVDVFQQ